MSLETYSDRLIVDHAEVSKVDDLIRCVPYGVRFMMAGACSKRQASAAAVRHPGDGLRNGTLDHIVKCIDCADGRLVQLGLKKAGHKPAPAVLKPAGRPKKLPKYTKEPMLTASQRELPKLEDMARPARPPSATMSPSIPRPAAASQESRAPRASASIPKAASARAASDARPVTRAEVAPTMVDALRPLPRGPSDARPARPTRPGSKQACSRCRTKGHNSRGCTQPVAPSVDDVALSATRRLTSKATASPAGLEPPELVAIGVGQQSRVTEPPDTELEPLPSPTATGFPDFAAEDARLRAELGEESGDPEHAAALALARRSADLRKAYQHRRRVFAAELVRIDSLLQLLSGQPFLVGQVIRHRPTTSSHPAATFTVASCMPAVRFPSGWAIAAYRVLDQDDGDPGEYHQLPHPVCASECELVPAPAPAL